MYKTYVFGVSYQTAHADVRNKISFANDEIPKVLARIQHSRITEEILILSTCNRMEVYCVTNDIDFVVNAVCEIKNICPRSIKQYSYIYEGESCARHLFKVASGLDSMILGENEIVAQIKNALFIAKNTNSLSSNLLGLFEMALSIEKDVRHSTAINTVSVSLGSAVNNIVLNKLNTTTASDLAQQKILFIGAGEMVNKIAPYFKSINCAQKTVVNRTYTKAKALANTIGANAVQLEGLSDILSDYSIIIACCASNSLLITPERLKQRIDAGKSTLIIDLSMPLISAYTLHETQSITLITIDDVAKIVDIGIEERKLKAKAAEEMIAGKLDQYQTWLRKKSLSPLIKAIRDDAEEMRLALLQVATRQLQNGSNPEEILNQLSIKLVNKMLHNPMVNLCAANSEIQDDLMGLMSYLYDLKLEAN